MLRRIKQKSNQHSNHDSAQASSESNFNEIETLSDADYEFLFEQLLEGVAHGWHQNRIAKFFQQLQQKNQAEHWINWLEKFGQKHSLVSTPSTQQLGVRMIRLGELTQSLPDLRQIGAVANQIGRQLFYGINGDLIWEYDGPDLESAQILSSPEPVLEMVNPEPLQQVPQDSVVPDLFREDSVQAVAENSPEQEDIALLIDNQVNTIIPTENFTSVINSGQKAEDVLSFSSNSSVTESESSFLINLEAQQQSINLFQEQEISLPATNDTTEQPLFLDNPLVTENDNSLLSDLADSFSLAEPQSQPLEQTPQTIIKAEVDSPNSLDNQSDNQLSSELVEGWFELGLKQATAGELGEAIISWEKALEINPNLSAAWHNRGSALGRLEKYSEAIKSFDRALVIDPNNYQAWNDRGHALYQIEKWEEAVASWDKAIEILPGDYQFWYNRGCALEKLKRSEQSIASYEKALEIKPDFQEAHSRYINLLTDNPDIN